MLSIAGDFDRVGCPAAGRASLRPDSPWSGQAAASGHDVAAIVGWVAARGRAGRRHAPAPVPRVSVASVWQRRVLRRERVRSGSRPAAVEADSTVASCASRQVAAEATAFTYDLTKGSDLLVVDVTARPGVAAESSSVRSRGNRSTRDTKVSRRTKSSARRGTHRDRLRSSRYAGRRRARGQALDVRDVLRRSVAREHAGGALSPSAHRTDVNAFARSAPRPGQSCEPALRAARTESTSANQSSPRSERDDRYDDAPERADTATQPDRTSQLSVSGIRAAHAPERNAARRRARRQASTGDRSRRSSTRARPMEREGQDGVAAADGAAATGGRERGWMARRSPTDSSESARSVDAHADWDAATVSLTVLAERATRRVRPRARCLAGAGVSRSRGCAAQGRATGRAAAASSRAGRVWRTSTVARRVRPDRPLRDARPAGTRPACVP